MMHAARSVFLVVLRSSSTAWIWIGTNDDAWINDPSALQEQDGTQHARLHAVYVAPAQMLIR